MMSRRLAVSHHPHRCPPLLYLGYSTVPQPLHPRPLSLLPTQTQPTPQEVTPYILSLLASSDWWPSYAASPPPPGAPYFTLLLANRAAADVDPRKFRRQAFGNSVMSE
jgi:hypothetical protein